MQFLEGWDVVQGTIDYNLVKIRIRNRIQSSGIGITIRNPDPGFSPKKSLFTIVIPIDSQE